MHSADSSNFITMMNPASLDTWTTIFFVVSFFGLFFSMILALNGKGQFKKNWPIALMVLGYSIVLFHYSLYWTGFLFTFPFLNFTVNAWFLCFGPLLYLYSRRDSLSRTMILLHFLPAVVTLIASFIFFLPYFDIHIFKTPSYLGHTLFWISTQPYIGIVSLLVYFILSVKTAKYNWSTIENPNFKQIYRRWMGILLLAFFLFILSYTSYFILINFPFFDISWDYGIGVGMSITLYTVGVFAFIEPDIFNGKIRWFTDSTLSNQFSSENKQHFYDQIVEIIEQEEMYLDGQLRMAHVAEKMGLSLQDTSRIINQYSKKNFNQFINSFRTEHAKTILSENPEMSIKEVCFSSGFNSKVSFFKSFKENTGQTPLQYREDNSVDE